MAEMELADQFLDRLQLALEREVAAGREAVAGTVDRHGPPAWQQPRDEVPVFGGAGQPVEQQHRRSGARPLQVAHTQATGQLYEAAGRPRCDRQTPVGPVEHHDHQHAHPQEHEQQPFDRDTTHPRRLLDIIRWNMVGV